MDSFTIAAIAIAIILSAIVRIIRTDAAWKAVEENYAGADHLRDLTGIVQRSALQDVFGPPTVEGIFHVPRSRVEQERRLTGHLMGNLQLDGISIAVGLVALVWRPYGSIGDLLNMFLFFVLAYQLAGWGATSLLMKEKG